MNTDPKATPPGWEPLPHKRMPRPTHYPAGLALGTTFLFWGVITSVVIFLVGVVLFAASLAGWIYEIRHERTHL
jgi:hypothetical protein